MPLKDKLKKHAPVLIAVATTATVAVAVTAAVVIRRHVSALEKTGLAAIDVVMDLGGDPQVLVVEKVKQLWPQK